jgi:hypothetical protein
MAQRHPPHRLAEIAGLREITRRRDRRIMVQTESTQPAKGAARDQETGKDRPTPKAFKIVIYTINLLLIFVPFGGMLYFMFDPDAFDAFLNWLVRML